MSPARKRTITIIILISISLLAGAAGFWLSSQPAEYSRYEFSQKKGMLFRFGERFSGKVVHRFKNGDIKELNSYLNGKRHGKQLRWFENGQKLWEETYQNGKKIGAQKGWHRNGEIRYLTQFIDGKKTGEQWTWFENGQTASYQLIQNEKEIQYKQWRPDGKIYTNYLTAQNDIVGVLGNELCKTVR